MSAEAQPSLEIDWRDETSVGNYFVANYPPFSFWESEQASEVEALLGRAADPTRELGLYVHIPFCRKRCDFCYFRVYTDKDSKSVRRYLDGVLSEMARYVEQPYIKERRPRFVYFGGGTPSYLSVEQLTSLFDGLQQHMSWEDAEEVTFECEPGTLQPKKIAALRELGVTRLSIGVENFDPEILELNNRAHRAKEIDAAYGVARDVGFEQINIDLIAGMVGETEANWQDCIAKTIAMAPDSVTIYQMEVPYNTTVYRRMKDGGKEVAPVADWATKRRWVDEAFAALEAEGYKVGSAYTAYRGDHVRFLYRDGLWHGADLLGLGVASFSHLDGVHAQNEHDFDPYLERIEKGELPIHRGLTLSDEERFLREFILQLKLGDIGSEYFTTKFGIDPTERFADLLAELEQHGWLHVRGKRIVLTRQGLLQVDRMLHSFFLPQHRGARYA